MVKKGSALVIVTLVALVVLLGRSAYADFSFDCFDQYNRVVARISLPEKSRINRGTQSVCNGGVGDPMICQDVSFRGEQKLASIALTTSSAPSAQMMVERTAWGGTLEPWQYFRGAGKLQADQSYVVSLDYADGLSPYQYQLSLRAANTSSNNIANELKCRKDF